MANGNHTPNDIETPPSPTRLATLLRSELKDLPPLSSKCCIYRVSERLRHANERAYTPQEVSIGPMHHDKKELKSMEVHKKRYLEDFLKQTNKSLEDHIKMIIQKEELLRSFYAEPIGFTRDEFVKIVLVDAAFIIGVLLGSSQNLNTWMLENIKNDLLMLENQLPFFIIKELLETVSSDDVLDLSFEFFNCTMLLGGTEDRLRRLKYRLRRFSSSDVAHFVDFIRRLYVPLPGSGRKRKVNTLTVPKMTELHRAGVKFMKSSSENLFDLKFSNGVLKIPQLMISDGTELTIRNLIAFEQYHCYQENYLSDYFVMMDCLIDTPEDVGLLVKYDIIENGLGDNAEVSTLINRLEDEVLVDYDHFYFAKIFEDLNGYCRTPWHKWKANLKQDYFNTPWAIASVIAAILLIILTIVQAVCSVISII